MAAFSELDWTKFDVTSIVANAGIGVIDTNPRSACHEQFGYALSPESWNLNALRDGFDFNLQAGTGAVIELVNADKAFSEDSGWFLNLIISQAKLSSKH
jgi:hypothetical protein